MPHVQEIFYFYPPFDFSLYLYPHAYRLLQNDASNLNQERSTSDSNRGQNKSRVTATVAYPTPKERSASSGQQFHRTVYYLETPKPSNLVLDVPITNGTTRLNPEQYEYDSIEAPQQFAGNLHVDWRAFNLDIWSQCYCRYDQNYCPTVREQQLLMELNCMKEDVAKAGNKSKRNIILDSVSSVSMCSC